MNATKRKFNSLIQGIGSRPSSPGGNTTIATDHNPQSSPATADTPTVPAVVAPTTPSRQGPATITAVPQDENHSSAVHVPTTTTTVSPSPSLSFSNILNKRRRVTGVLESTLSGNKAASPASRFANNNILKKYGGATATPSTGRIEKPVPASRYCPGDRDELIRRLGTFQELTEWTPKPDRINEIEWAKRGWVCQGKERVRCTLCNRELVVKLSNEKKRDSTEEGYRPSTAPAKSQVEEAMIARFAEFIIEAHHEDCLWRKQGCDDSLLRLSITSPQTALTSLRERYDDLASRPIFLPYLFNLRLPDDLQLEKIKSQLPANFYTDPPPKTTPTATVATNPNSVALALALTGWQGLTNPRIGPVPNSASCATCLRKLGLWMFKSKEVDESTGQVLVPAPMDYLDPVREHRFFCPWRNPAAQRNPGSKSPDSKAAWEVLVQTLKNNAYLKSQAERSNQKNKNKTPLRTSTLLRRGTASGPVTPSRGTTGNDPTTPNDSPFDQGDLVMLGPDMVDDEDEDPEARDAKDKERWARLRKVKALFDTKGAKKMRRALSRPGTAGSSKSSGDNMRPPTAGTGEVTETS